MFTDKMNNFLRNNLNLPTPFMLFDLDILKARYMELSNNFPKSELLYAVKCNPNPQVLETLAALGSSFDVASMEEIKLCLSLGISAEKLSWNNTIKKSELIKEAYNLGINSYAFDSLEELEKIAKAAPGANVFCRIATSNKDALWPLDLKFGCDSNFAIGLIVKAKELKLNPYGISFHTGSQQINTNAWVEAIKNSSLIFKTLKEQYNIKLTTLNIGGGYPAYETLAKAPKISQYSEVVFKALSDYFPATPMLLLEPGRFLVSDAGIIKSKVILTSNRGDNDNRWIYLDIGVFNGLTETIGESIKYIITTDKDHLPNSIPSILAGPTCDSMDVMYKNYKYMIPSELTSNDCVYIHGTGGYTTTYSSVGFNGILPLKDYYV